MPLEVHHAPRVTGWLWWFLHALPALNGTALGGVLFHKPLELDFYVPSSCCRYWFGRC